MKPLKFIHIPKTGGTSIEDVGAEHNLKWGRFHKEYDTDNKKGVYRIHILPKYLRCLHRYDWFTIVRNPYQRALSSAHAECNVIKIKTRHDVLSVHTVESFDNFVKYLIKRDSSNDMGGHQVPQHKFTEGVPNLTILKFENLKEEFDELMKRYNLDIRLDKHSNSTQHIRRFDVEDLSHETINLINDVYRLDFEKFGYNVIKET